MAGLLEELNITEDVTLVIHDWGSALGFHWAKHHPEAVKGIAYMEAIVCPVTWDDWPESARGIFKGFRSDKGEDLILQRNMFVEAVLPSSVIRQMGEEEMNQYRKPFIRVADRQPTLNWPRQIPIDGEPPHMVDLVASYGEWMASNQELPKLFINAAPGVNFNGQSAKILSHLAQSKRSDSCGDTFYSGGFSSGNRNSCGGVAKNNLREKPKEGI